MDKAAIKKFAEWAREKLISDIVYKAGSLGITDKGIAEKLPQSTSDLQFYDIGTKDYAVVEGEAITQRAGLVNALAAAEKSYGSYKEAFENVVEEVAYTWFNRLIAIRFMEVNDYLPGGVRVLSSETAGKDEPDLVTNPYDGDLKFTPYEDTKIMQLKDENKVDELFRMLFIKECNKLHDILPRLFEETADYTELLLTINYTDKEGVVYHLVHDIAEDNFDVEKEGQVEIIGWMYQYYNAVKKDEVFAALKKNVKITKANIPAATQLFTPDWIVRYMVENSLGRLWVEGHPDNNDLKANWKYYLEEAKQEPEVEVQLAEIRKEYAKLQPEDIKVIDPCMGSGHILVYLFDVLMQIYEAKGYAARDAVKSILENNLYGLDIDIRATQLAYFAVMMKARQYDRRFFTSDVQPQVYAICESNQIEDYTIDAFCDGDKEITKAMQTIKNEMYDAKEYGSIINVSPQNWDLLYKRIKEKQVEQGMFDHSVEDILPVIQVAELLATKYDAAITNPPYMGSSNMNNKLQNFIKEYYSEFKSDLFATFILKLKKLVKENRFYSLITQQAWMHKSSYKQLRKVVYENIINSLVHLGAHAFDEINGEVVQTVTFSQRKTSCANYRGTYISLEEYNSETSKCNAFSKNKNVYVSTSKVFLGLPNQPLAYWCTDKQANCFVKNKKLSDSGITACAGLNTSDNGRFVRCWYEVKYDDVGFDCESYECFLENKKKYALFNKGGGYRKWYGNQWFIIAFDEKNYNLLLNMGNKLPSKQYYFKPSLTWNRIAPSTSFSVRKCNAGFAFDDVSPSAFMDITKREYVIGLMNSKPFVKLLCILNRGMKTETGNVQKIPFIWSEHYSEDVVLYDKQCIKISKDDWDLFEISWDFSNSPLINKKHIKSNKGTLKSNIKEAYENYKILVEKRFGYLKLNEEKLNRIFIEIYGLQDELTPEVEDKDVTVHRIFDTKEEIPESMGNSKYALTKQDVIKSFISYAVGCMLGRYSLDVEGLAYAGGAWDDSKYTSFIPDADNCIPITDTEYFTDDIVGRFVEFLKVVYGVETLEENLTFIADALGNKGNTSREVIRNYFLSDFIKDHNKTYQKRPIYWLFDSGKQNGFKALVYMHRWNADTTGNVRVEYLHKMQRIYERELERLDEIITTSTVNKEITAATKRKEKINKQIKETKEYDAKIAHLALARIDIDLDDGVKVNYEKVQTDQEGKKIQVLAKI